MKKPETLSQPNLFRSSAWVQAWIDNWGQHPAVELIDLGGRGEPLETVYRVRQRLKGFLPIGTLCLAGTGYGPVSCPRAEYIQLDAFGEKPTAGGPPCLAEALHELSWSQVYLPDLTESAKLMVTKLASESGWLIHQERREYSYAIENVALESYLSGLSGNTRARFFNRRGRLESIGQVSRQRYTLRQSDVFFDEHDRFHYARWGHRCYSERSRRFMQNFLERLEYAGGEVIMEVQTLDDRPISTLFDVIWQDRRYNLQSGYRANPISGLSLGALHLGLAIEESLKSKLNYDLLAGRGKSSNYKEAIANTYRPLTTLILQKPWLGQLRKLVNSLDDLNWIQKKPGKDCS